jgi:hypothetical protein
MALKQYIENARAIAGTFEIYNGKLNMTGFSGTYPYLESAILQNIKYVKESKKISKYVNAPKTAPPVEVAFACYSEIIIIRSKLQECLDIFINHQASPIQKGSQTSTGSTITSELIYDLQNNLSDLIEIMNGYLTESDVNKLTDTFADQIAHQTADAGYVSHAQVTTISDEYQSYVKRGDGIFVINLFEMIMQNAMDLNTGHPEGAKVIKKIMVLLESLKTSIVQSPRLELVGIDNKKNNTVQRLIQWNNLIPHEELLPFADLINKLIGVKCQEKGLDSACKIVSTATEKIGFIVMHKISKNPMEHRIMSLIQSGDSGASATAGIDKKLYERTQTIRVLTVTPGHARDSITVYDNEHEASTTNYFYIVETLDGETFRILHPWGIHTHNFKIPASWVQNIPDTKKTPSKRLAGYSELINDAILVHLQKPILQIDFMNRNERLKADIKWKNIKDNIIRKLQEIYADKITKQGISALVTSNKFQNSMIQEIIAQLEDVSIEGTNAPTDLYHEELSLSYIKDLDAIQNRLGRELANMYQKEHKGSSKPANVIFQDLINSVLSKLINSKSNIFNTIQYKSELLRKTLLA